MRALPAVLALALAGAAAAQPGAAPAPAPAEAAGAPASLVQAIGGPEFEQLRDPFWPIGWRPDARPDGKATVSPAVPLKWAEAKKRLQLTGVIRTNAGKRMASIKGVGVVEEGDVISVHFENAVYRWLVRTITDTEIVTEQLGVSPDSR